MLQKTSARCGGGGGGGKQILANLWHLHKKEQYWFIIVEHKIENVNENNPFTLIKFFLQLISEAPEEKHDNDHEDVIQVQTDHLNLTLNGVPDMGVVYFDQHLSAVQSKRW